MTTLAVRVSSATPDPVPGNNAVRDLQTIKQAVAPPAPTTKERAAAPVLRGQTLGLATLSAGRPSRSDEPGPRGTSRTRATSWPQWYKISNRANVWVTATNIALYGGLSDLDTQYSTSATMWAFEGGNSRVIRIELTNRLHSSGFHLPGSGLKSTGTYAIPDDSRSFKVSYPKQWTYSASGADQVMEGTWSFIRAGLSRNVKKSYLIQP